MCALVTGTTQSDTYYRLYGYQIAEGQGQTVPGIWESTTVRLWTLVCLTLSAFCADNPSYALASSPKVDCET